MIDSYILNPASCTNMTEAFDHLPYPWVQLHP